MYHILFNYAGEELSFITDGMYSFGTVETTFNDVISTTPGVGKYNSCIHVHNLKIVPTLFASRLGKTVTIKDSDFTIRNQCDSAGYIAYAATSLNSDGSCYVHATASVLGPYWDTTKRGKILPITIQLYGSVCSKHEAVEVIGQYFDEVMTIDPRCDVLSLIHAVPTHGLTYKGLPWGSTLGRYSYKSITPGPCEMTHSEIVKVIEHVLRVAVASYDDASLLNEALESFRLDLGITKELIDTATNLAAVKTVAEAAKALLPDSPRKFKSLNEFAKYLASTKLWWEYGCKLPLHTLKEWSTALKPQQIAKYCLSPGELRSGVKRVSYNGALLTDPENTVQITMDTRLGLGLKPQSTTIEFINSLYRYGVLLNLADGWDLIPLSFAVNWVTTLPQQFAQKLSNYADYWRFRYSYAKRTWKGTATFAGPYTVSFDFYIRNYSRDIPSMSLNKQISVISDEGIRGNLSISSLDEAVAIVTVFT